MKTVDLVLIGASAGGVDALLVLLQDLQPGDRVPIVVVLHLPQEHESRLAAIVGSRLGLRACEAQAHAPLQGGTIHFAPPGYHLLVEADRTLSLSCEAPVHFSRPSIDVLFESAAVAFGDRVAGIVLTGANDDGAAGLQHIRRAGGLTVVQDPGEAAHATMPRAALEAADPEYVLPLEALRTLLQRLLTP